MNETLLQLREHLASMLAIIDNYQLPDADIIIINKEDLKYLKWVSSPQPYVQLFEYKNSCKFTLRSTSSSIREFEVYKKLLMAQLIKYVLIRFRQIMRTL
jgi:hypothetical protein